MYLGDADSTQRIGTQVVIPAVSAVGGAFTPAIASGLFGSAVAGTMPLWAIPVVGAAIAGVTIALAAIFSRKGPKQKELATQAANQVEDLLRKNVEGYFQGERTVAAQTMALENFDQAWAWLISQDGCGSAQLGEPGRRCIAERQRGGSAPWCPTGTGCDWFALYRDPIANDPRPGELAAATAAGDGGSISDVFNSGPEGSVGLLALLGLGLLVWGISRQ